MDKNKARENIQTISNILERLKIKWWLEAGTCLGAIREGKFIDYDLDTDIGLIISDKADIWYLARDLIKEGFSLIHDFGTVDNGYEFSFRRFGVKTDFFLFYEEENILWHSAWKNKKQLFFEFSKELFENLKEIDFLGIKAFVPNPPEKYLTERYGDWKIPIEKWNWAKDPKCINWEKSELKKEDI